ncbi:hypothetical protein HZH68_013348 [Vespula germanica]|uniref:Uncharacterized protein n=1 Tax=Vespula germanica TaxID=30212 RepID=A0A834JEK2_VESGE|nr:hypothetical protein HZH68_013348 [Vespula germanica]
MRQGGPTWVLRVAPTSRLVNERVCHYGVWCEESSTSSSAPSEMPYLRMPSRTSVGSTASVNRSREGKRGRIRMGEGVEERRKRKGGGGGGGGGGDGSGGRKKQ